MTKTTIEKIEGIKAQIRQLENQEKQLIQKQKADERKARTKRLIERGAILESLIENAETLTNEQIKTFLEKTIKSEFATRMLNGLKPQDGTITITERTATAPSNTQATPQIQSNTTRQEG